MPGKNRKDSPHDRRSTSKALTVSFQVQEINHPHLYHWVTSTRWGEKSAEIRDILENATRKATFQGNRLAVSLPSEQQTAQNLPLPSELLPELKGEHDTNDEANHSVPGDNLSSTDAIISSMINQF